MSAVSITVELFADQLHVSSWPNTVRDNLGCLMGCAKYLVMIPGVLLNASLGF